MFQFLSIFIMPVSMASTVYKTNESHEKDVKSEPNWVDLECQVKKLKISVALNALQAATNCHTKNGSPISNLLQPACNCWLRGFMPDCT